LPFDDDRFDAFEEHGELSGTDEGDGFAITGECNGNSEPTGFETLVPKGVAITIPIKDFESVGNAIDKNEKSAVERILFETVFDNGGETIEGFSHIDGTRRNINGSVGAVQHGTLSSCRMMPHNVSEDVSTGKRRVKPFFVTSSILPVGTIEGGSTWIGKNVKDDLLDDGVGTMVGAVGSL
jgi:hypothetical protein